MKENFKNTKEVLSYLQAEGYKIKKSKIYEDKKSGILRVQKNGSILKADVILYQGTLKHEDPSENVEAAKRKIELENKKLTIQIEKEEFALEKEKGKYIPRKDFELELSARAAVLEAGFKYMFNLRVVEWIALVNGDISKAEILLKKINEDFDIQINEFASTKKYQVMIIDD